MKPVFYLLLVLLFVPFVLADQTSFTNSSSVWTVPTNVTSIFVEVWGGGGNGGNVTGSTGAGGGGGGAYAASVLSVVPGTNYTIVVAQSGTGGNSYFNSTSTVFAKGGGNASTNSVTGGTGGQASASIGNITYSGGDGGNGDNSPTWPGGGGGGAGTTQSGTSGVNSGGISGAGGGAGGNDYGGNGGGTEISGSGNDGGAGSTIGGGGGGAWRTSGITRIGGSGARGEVRITYGNTVFYIFDEDTLQAITNSTVSAYLVNPDYGFNFSTTSGNYSASVPVTGEYSVVVSASGYSQRNYIINVNGSSNSFYFYLLRDGYGTVQVTDYNPSYVSVPGLVNVLLRKNATADAYYEVERCSGDSNGQCIMSLSLCTTTNSSCPYYKILVYSGTSIVGDTGAKRYSTNSISIIVNNVNNLISINDRLSATQYLSNFTSNASISYTYDNTNNAATSVSLVITRRIGTSYATINSVTTSGSGILVLNTAGASNLGDEIIARGYWTTSDGVVHLGATKSFIDPDSGLGGAKSAALAWVGLGLNLAPLLAFGMNPPIAIFVSCVIFFFTNAIGLSSLTTSIIGGITILGFIVVWLINRN